jgi:glycine cleavage system regulatory protein
MTTVLDSLVIAVLGPDQPGLVERISALVARHGGNWLEGHLSSAGGFFGGIVHITVPAGTVSELTGALQNLESQGLQVIVQASLTTGKAPAGEPVEISVIGNDRPGIVNRISQAIAERGVNIVELDTEYSSAPMAGHPIFTARAALELPPGVRFEDLKMELEKIANDLVVDLSLNR